MKKEQELVLWRLVETLGWKDMITFKDYYDIPLDEKKYNKIFKKVEENLSCYTPSTIKQIEEFVSKMENKLYNRVWKYAIKQEKNGIGHRSTYYNCGDDTFSDLCSHIVGLGKEEFDKVMNNPELFKERSNKHDYMEKFSYIFMKGV